MSVKYLLPLVLVPVLAQASDECVLQERTVAQSHINILERSKIRRDVVPSPNGHHKCMVSFRVRVGTEWHNAFGEYVWGGDRPSNEACAIAVDRAESSVRERLGRNSAISERVLVCNDRQDLKTLRSVKVGTVGDHSQFRAHPLYPNRFYHNGTQCRWFLEPAFTGQDIRQYQGVICEIQDSKWVVVDKF